MSIFTNYLRTAGRNSMKYKGLTLLNILGLAIGIAASLLILQFVIYEHGYDSFHLNSSNIYRIRYDNYRSGKLEFSCAAAVPAVGPAMKDNFPEVIDYTWAFPVSGIISKDNISFRENKLQIVTPSFFSIFSWNLIKGDTAALSKPYTAVMTQSAARKYFGEEDPIGKEIKWDGRYSFNVVGICEDVPDNSHLKFSIVFSAETLHQLSEGQSRTAWGWYDFNTYIMLDPLADPHIFQEKFGEWLQEERKEEWVKYNSRQEFILQPIQDIHLYSDLLQESEPEENGDGSTVFVLLLIALSVMIIAWVNYINLSTSRAIERSLEVGMRKVTGASKNQLIKQFMTESFMLNLIAALLSVLIIIWVLPYFNRLTGRALSFDLFKEARFWLSIIGLFFIGSFFSGLYPAFVLSAFNPVEVIKGKMSSTGSGIILRKMLVIFQFSASIALIAGTAFVYLQLQYMRNMDLGVNIDQTLVIRGPGIVIDTTFAEKFRTFKNEVSNIAGVHNLTASTNVPGDEIFWASGIQREDEQEGQTRVIYIIGMDEDYIPAFDIELIAGRNFSDNYGTEDLSVILNKGGVELLGYNSPEDAVGQKVNFHGELREIVGVISNYHQMSMKQVPIPLAYRYLPANRSFFAMKVNTDNLAPILSSLQQVWEDFFQGNPFEYFFLDEFFDRQYRIEKQVDITAGIFSSLAIIMAVLGLVGLSSYTTLQRTKEIGIRKVLGSNFSRILLLLSREYIQLIMIAFVISVPPVIFIIRSWLNQYPYKISISWGVFAGSGFLVILFSILAVALQTIRAAQINPADSLKYE